MQLAENSTSSLNRLWFVFMGTGLILKPWSDVHSESRFNSKTCEAFQTFSTKNVQKLA